MTQDTIHITTDTIRQARRVMLAYATGDDRYREFIVKLAVATGMLPHEIQTLTRHIASLDLPT